MRARPDEVYSSRRAPAMRAESCNCNFQVNTSVLMGFLIKSSTLDSILIMSAVAWLNGWYKRTDGKSAIRVGTNADIAGGGG